MTKENEDPQSNSEHLNVEPHHVPQVVNLQTSSVGMVKAELVRLHQSIARTVTSDEVALHQGIALDVATAQVKAHEAALGLVTTGEAYLTNSGAGVLRAENVSMEGTAGVVLTGSANLGNTYAGMVAGREVRGERIESLLVLARRIDGEVHTVVDTRGAVIAGMVWGLFTGVILLLGRLLFGRRG
jgi:hypothetical protein